MMIPLSRSSIDLRMCVVRAWIVGDCTLTRIRRRLMSIAWDNIRDNDPMFPALVLDKNNPDVWLEFLDTSTVRFVCGSMDEYIGLAEMTGSLQQRWDWFSRRIVAMLHARKVEG